MSPSTHTLRHLQRDSSGSVTIFFALSLLVMCIVAGIAIDSARVESVSSKIGAALDAAALTAAKRLDVNATDSEIQTAAEEFFNASLSGAAFHGAVFSNLTATTDRINSGVTLSVDVALRTTFGRLAGIDRFQFNKVTTVVYGTRPIELAMVLDVTGSMDDNGKISALKNAAIDLIEFLSPVMVPGGKTKVALAPFSASVNAGAFSAAVSGGASVDGCVFERDGASAFQETSPTSGQPLNSMPDPSNPTNDKYVCPSAAISPLTTDADALKSAVNSYNADGATAGHIGLAWGWYLISPNWSSLWPAASVPAEYPSDDKGVLKAVILMTDGEFNTSYWNGPHNATSADQARQLCANMKAAGVTIYSVALNAPASAQTLLAECASSPEQYFNVVDGGELRAAFTKVGGSLVERSLHVSR